MDKRIEQMRAVSCVSLTVKRVLHGNQQASVAGSSRVLEHVSYSVDSRRKPARPLKTRPGSPCSPG